MSDYQSKAMPASRGDTLNSLKDELYSLNMRMLLAMQNHDEATQEDIKTQIAMVQAAIDQMCLGGGHYR